jgi:predicted N-acetyltransferase YhbS
MMSATLTERELERREVELIWTIDRREEIEGVYTLEDGQLVLKPVTYHMQGWPPGEPEKYAPILGECFANGGWFYGIFDQEQLAAVTVLENHFIGKERDMLQLKMFQVSCEYRHRGLGKRLFTLSKEKARQLGARWMYISATPSQNTIGFYFSQGSRLAPEPDAELFALEPEDIHLICPV